MEINTGERFDTTFSDPTSTFIACLLIAVVLMTHFADRGGIPKRGIRMLLLVVVAASILLYMTGILGLMGEVVVLLRSSTTSLRSSAGIAKFCKDVQGLALSRLLEVVLLITMLYIFLQALCVPGTLALNAVVGALLGTLVGVPYCTLLGTVGASCCYMLSNLFGMRLVERADAHLMKGKGLPKIRAQVNRYRDDLVVYLLFLRLTPILPNWLVNLAAPVVGVPLHTFALATFIGIIPQTYLSVRFGVFARSSADGNEHIFTPWDSLLLFVIGIALLTAASLRKRFLAAPPSSVTLFL